MKLYTILILTLLLIPLTTATITNITINGNGVTTPSCNFIPIVGWDGSSNVSRGQTFNLTNSETYFIGARVYFNLSNGSSNPIAMRLTNTSKIGSYFVPNASQYYVEINKTTTQVANNSWTDFNITGTNPLLTQNSEYGITFFTVGYNSGDTKGYHMCQYASGYNPGNATFIYNPNYPNGAYNNDGEQDYAIILFFLSNPDIGLNLLTPTNNAHIGTNPVLYSFNLTNVDGLANCTLNSLYTNQSPYYFTNLGNGTSQVNLTVTATGPVEQNNTWNVTCNDTTHTNNFSGNYGFIFDITPPTVTWRTTSESETKTFYAFFNKTQFNDTISDNWLYYANFSILRFSDNLLMYNTTNTGFGITQFNNTILMNFSNYTTGRYQYYAIANDSVNTLFSVTNFIVNTTPYQATNLNITQTGSKVLLNWTNSSYSDYTNVYRNGTLLAQVTGKYYNDTTINGGRTYNYTVLAGRNDGELNTSIYNNNNTQSFTTVSNNSIRFYARDLITNVTINNIDMVLNGPATYTNNSWSDQITWLNLVAGTYSVIANTSTTGYNTVYDTFTINTDENITKFLYFTSGNPVLFYVRDINTQGIPNAFVSIAKFDGTPITSKYTDIVGTALFYLNSNINYLINITAPGFTGYYGNLSPSLSTYTFTLYNQSAYNMSTLAGFNTNFWVNTTTLVIDNFYTFNFTVTSDIYNITDCFVKFQDKNGNVISGPNSCYINKSYGFVSTSFNVTNATYIYANATINTGPLTFGYGVTTSLLSFIYPYGLKQYQPGTASMWYGLIRIKNFNGSGWDNFGRLIIGMLVLIGVLSFANRLGDTYSDPEKTMLLIWATVGILSLAGLMRADPSWLPGFQLMKLSSGIPVYIQDWFIFTFLSAIMIVYLITQKIRGN